MKRLGEVVSFVVSAFIIVALGGAAINWFMLHWGPADYVTVYERVCLPKGSPPADQSYWDCKNAGGATFAISSTFRVDYERQRAFALGAIPMRYDNCEIADKLNWACKYNDGSGWLQIAEGKYLRSERRSAEQIGWFEYTLDQR